VLLDILIGVPIIVFILFGARDGVVRKLVAIVVMLAGLILGQLFMNPVGSFFAGEGNPDAPMYGFLFTFLGLVILQSILYRTLTTSYKIGGIADRVGGTILGFFEGALFISCMLYIFALSGFPDRVTKRDARFYNPVVNIAPKILDITSTISSEALEKLKDTSSPETSDSEKMKKGARRSTDGSKKPK